MTEQASNQATADQPQSDPPAALMMVEVTNTLDFPIEDMFDGVPVRIAKGETITVEPHVAMHCFGYPGEFRDMARHMARRYGWQGREYLTPDDKRVPLFEQMAAKVVFTPIYYDLVPRRRGNDPIPADDDRTDPPRAAASRGPDTGTKVGARKKALSLGGKSARRRPRVEKAR